MVELRQLSEEQILMGFVASCIEDVADKLGVDYLEVYKRMDAVGSTMSVAVFTCLATSMSLTK